MEQHLFIYIDDSGKISNSEDYSGFAGILFRSTSEKSKFSNKYKSILKDISCKYCPLQKHQCLKKCPEIKGSSIKTKDRRRILNLSHQFYTFGVRIDNNRLFPHIKADKASKGRYTDFAIKRMIKEVIIDLLNAHLIAKDDDIIINIYIDEMSTKSSGYYTLEESIKEELYFGISNFNYHCYFPPILTGVPKIYIRYQKSDQQVGIQMADILANTIVREAKHFHGSSEHSIEAKYKINKMLFLP